VPSKPTAHGGDTIELSSRPGGTVSITVKTDLSTWPEFPLEVGFGAERKADGRWETESIHLADIAAAQQWLRKGAQLPLPTGTWSIGGGNLGIEPGRVDAVEVRPRSTTSKTIALRARRVAEDAEARLEIEIDPSIPGTGGSLVWKSGRQVAFSFAHP